MNKPPKSLWGPWSPVPIGDCERIAQLRCLRTLVHVIIGSRKAPDYTDTVPALLRALRDAEASDRERLIVALGDDVAPRQRQEDMDEARLLFDSLPAARQRDIIATFAVLHKPLTLPKGE
jgi:hypothetical protein